MLFKVLAVMNNQGKNLQLEHINVSLEEEDFLFSAEEVPHDGGWSRAQVVITRKDKVIQRASYTVSSNEKTYFNEVVEEDLKDPIQLKNVDSAFQNLLCKAKKSV